MHTSDTETGQWGAIWKQGIDGYDASAVLDTVEQESTGVRCQKITGYLSHHLGDLSGKRTIEVGCGGAVYSLILAQLGARVTLLDYSSEAIALAERNLSVLDLDGELIQADVFKLSPELLGIYDVAMSFGTVEHYRSPRRLGICRSHVDLVRPGGVVIISAPNILFLPHEILKTLLAARGKWFLGYEGSFSRSELSRVGRELGLRDVRIVGSSWLADLRRYVQIVRHTRTFRSWFRPLGLHKLSPSSRPQTHHWLDDFLGHDIVLMGVKQSVE